LRHFWPADGWRFDDVPYHFPHNIFFEFGSETREQVPHATEPPDLTLDLVKGALPIHQNFPVD
jgi:hypothetical protein